MIPVFSAAAAEAGIDLAPALMRVLQRHHYLLGDELSAFEREFAAYVGVQHCVGVANGTDALELALRACGVDAGDRVVTAANAGFYSSTAIHAIGGEPVYVDVSDVTLTLEPEALAAVLPSSRPKAVIVTHLYGQLADVRTLAALCEKAGVPLIEDCAQAHGSALDGRRAGSFGSIGCFSFYPTKNLGALGDGGAVVANDRALADKVRALRQYGWAEKYAVSMRGGRNSRLDELQAAVLRDKLTCLDKWNAERRRIGARYNAALKGLPVQLPLSTGEDTAMHLYVVRSAERDRLRRYLAELDIATAIHYPIADHLQPAYRTSSHRLPVTERACAECLTLPCFPGLADADVSSVIEGVRSFFART